MKSPTGSHIQHSRFTRHAQDYNTKILSSIQSPSGINSPFYYFMCSLLSFISPLYYTNTVYVHYMFTATKIYLSLTSSKLYVPKIYSFYSLNLKSINKHFPSMPIECIQPFPEHHSLDYFPPNLCFISPVKFHLIFQ